MRARDNRCRAMCTPRRIRWRDEAKSCCYSAGAGNARCASVVRLLDPAGGIMKRSDSGDFCVLYIEPEDEKLAVFALLREQSKPVVILLQPSGAQTRGRVFQRPEDFSDLKHLRRQHNLTVFFVITGNDYLRQLAARNGFSTFTSIDALGDALEEGRSSLARSEEHTSELQSPVHLVCRLLLEKKKRKANTATTHK